ncbi:Tyrosine-protein phosphatase non-receptor type 12 [Tupaia chinensis]|uniref:Tyrosine-protein phosphatase non-receptor type 12 n=1 Tax=Tupaia chinensis TaxID=246437 RepID=L9LAW4_TUPCH|nr:Tyrosine-protein phosphatase non-receptor type 12 [Tupaia chinensis]
MEQVEMMRKFIQRVQAMKSPDHNGEDNFARDFMGTQGAAAGLSPHPAPSPVTTYCFSGREPKANEVQAGGWKWGVVSRLGRRWLRLLLLRILRKTGALETLEVWGMEKEVELWEVVAP